MDWTTNESEYDSQQRQEIFLLSTASKLVLGPTQTPTRQEPRSLSLGTKQLREKLATHLNLVPTLRMHEVIPWLPPNVFMSWYLIKLMTTRNLPNGKFYHNHTNSISYSIHNLYLSTILGARDRVAG
jgi:hypothetical protein